MKYGGAALCQLLLQTVAFMTAKPRDDTGAGAFLHLLCLLLPVRIKASPTVFIFH